MKKVFALVLSLALLLGIAVPGTLAMDADPTAESTAAATEATVPATTAETTAATVETTAPAGETKSKTEDDVSAAQAADTAATTAATEATTPATTEETKAPETPAHIETCSDTCTTEGCKCPCHLYNKLMAAKSIEEMDAIFAATEDSLLKALTEAQWEKIDAHYCEIEPAPAPAIILEVSDPPVASEVYSETVNYDNVAPFVGDAG